MNCPMCGVSLDNTAAPAHSCQINLGPATFTPSHPTYPMRCKDCGGHFDSTKHQMTCVAPTLIDPRDAEIARLNLQNEEYRKALLRVAQEFGCSGHDECDWYKEVQRVLGLAQKRVEGPPKNEHH